MCAGSQSALLPHLISRSDTGLPVVNRNMNRQVHGSCSRIISFNSQASDGSSQHLSAEEKACLKFLEETIKSIVAEDDALSSDDAQSSGNTISKNHQGRSSCNSFPVTGSPQDLSAEERACLAFLEETIDSIEDSGLSTDDAKSLPELRNIISKRTHINQIKNYLVPTPFVLASGIGNINPKHGIAFPKDKTPHNKDNSPQNDQLSPDDASHWGPLSCDGLVELCKRLSMIKTSVEKQPATHDAQMSSKKTKNVSESPSSKPNPPVVAPKPKKIPSHIASFNHEGTTIPNPDSNLHCLSTSPENYGLTRPDKAKLEALSKLGLLKEDVIPENKQGLDAPLSSSFPDWPQKKTSN